MGFPIPVKATTHKHTHTHTHIAKDERNCKKTREDELRLLYTNIVASKHIVISNNIFSTLYSIFIVFASSSFCLHILLVLVYMLSNMLARSLGLVVWRFCYLCVYANVGTVLLII